MSNSPNRAGWARLAQETWFGGWNRSPPVDVEGAGRLFRRRRVSVSSSVEEKVVSIVSEQLNVAKSDIKLESKFVDDLKADSLDVVELVMEFEEEFEVTIPDEDYEKIQTVGDAVKYISEKLGG
jgi:acyl carrier protein